MTALPYLFLLKAQGQQGGKLFCRKTGDLCSPAEVGGIFQVPSEQRGAGVALTMSWTRSCSLPGAGQQHLSSAVFEARRWSRLYMVLVSPSRSLASYAVSHLWMRVFSPCCSGVVAHLELLLPFTSGWGKAVAFSCLVLSQVGFILSEQCRCLDSCMILPNSRSRSLTFLGP